MAFVGSQSRAEAFERAFNKIVLYLGLKTHLFLTLLTRLLATTPCDIDQTVIDLSKLLQNVPAAFFQLNAILHPYGHVEFDPRRSPITSYVLTISGTSRIVLLDPPQKGGSQFHNLTAPQLRGILAKLDSEDPIYENLLKVTDSNLRDALAQLAQDILDSNIPKNCRKNALKFLRHSGGVPPSLLLNELEQLAQFQCTYFSDLYHGKLQAAKVVIKKPRILKGDLDKAELLREVILYRQFRHPNILPFVGVSCDDRDWLYGLVTPFMAHGNIIEFLQRHPNTNRLVPVFQIMKGLEFLHTFDFPIAHRDIKGANVLVDDNLVCRLSDFGLSSIPELSQRSREHTVGTAAWMAPEILAPPEHGRLDLFKADIFALGITILEIYDGKPPLLHRHFYAIYTSRVTRREKPHFSPNCPHPFPTFLSEVVGMMLEYGPQERPNIRMICQGIEDVLSPPLYIATETTDCQIKTKKPAFDDVVRARAQELVESEWERIGKLTGLQDPQASGSVTKIEPLQNGPQSDQAAPSQTVVTLLTPLPEAPRGSCSQTVISLRAITFQVGGSSNVASVVSPTTTKLTTTRDDHPATPRMQHPRLKLLITPPTSHNESHNCSIPASSPKRNRPSFLTTGDPRGHGSRPLSSLECRVGSPVKRRRRNGHSVPSSPITATNRPGDLHASMH